MGKKLCHNGTCCSVALGHVHILLNGTVPVIRLYEVKVGKLSEALNKNF